MLLLCDLLEHGTAYTFDFSTQIIYRKHAVAALCSMKKKQPYDESSQHGISFKVLTVVTWQAHIG